MNSNQSSEFAMLDVQQAIAEVIAKCSPTQSVDIPIGQAAGFVAARSVQARLDVPPYDKAMMDGYAIRHQDFEGGKSFEVIGRLTAGENYDSTVGQDSALQIMTGAPIPDGASAVVMFERTNEYAAIDEPFDRDAGPPLPNFVRFDDAPRSQQNILARGTVMRCGDEIIPAGKTLQPIDLGMAIDAGIANVDVHRQVTVSILATGDELVTAGETLSPGQIYNSNGPMLAALARQSGAEVTELGIVRDNREQMQSAIAEGLRSDVLILSGGVSAGVLDLVPELLRDAGVEQIFHKVRLKPGKPVWFGKRDGDSECNDSESNRSSLVFGLPGNPVSSFVCFQLFARTAIRALGGRARGGRARGDRAKSGTWIGRANAALQETNAVLTADHLQKGDRPTYWPSVYDESDNRRFATPAAWRGSADLRTVAQANSLVIFPPGDKQFRAGDEVAVIRLPAL